MDLWHAVILAIIEGLTEYLPVSSTGHIILGSALMGIESQPLVKEFTVIVQFGAILSVLVLYRQQILGALRSGPRVLIPLLVAFVPAAAAGLLFGKVIDRMIGEVVVVGWSLLLGGVIMLFFDRLGKNASDSDALKLDWRQALKIGLFQCLALVPGVSRSGSTIGGGLAVGLSRKTAAEFSFYLAVPTLTAATAYKLIKMGDLLTVTTIPIFLLGNIVSFVVGILAIKAFIGFLQKHGFFWFGIYRIVAGLVILALIYSGHTLRML